MADISQECVHDTHTGTELRTCTLRGCTCQCHPRAGSLAVASAVAYEAGRDDERERCARLAEQEAVHPNRIGLSRIVALRHVADLIRARSTDGR